MTGLLYNMSQAGRTSSMAVSMQKDHCDAMKAN